MQQSCQQQPPQQVELINRVPGMQEPAAFLHEHNFGQIISSNNNPSSSSSSLASSAGNVINGNNSVIVHPPRLTTIPANVQMVEEGNSSMAKTKRALNPEGEKQHEQQLMEPTQTKMAKMESVARSLTPEVLGVHRFISPFSAEAKIPLPHELNELRYIHLMKTSGIGDCPHTFKVPMVQPYGKGTNGSGNGSDA
jgi:hypothetical protein